MKVAKNESIFEMRAKFLPKSKHYTAPLWDLQNRQPAVNIQPPRNKRKRGEGKSALKFPVS